MKKTTAWGMGVTAAAAAFLGLSVAAHAAAAKPSPCKGLEETACGTKTECGWTKATTDKNGKARKAYCHLKATGAAAKAPGTEVKKAAAKTAVPGTAAVGAPAGTAAGAAAKTVAPGTAAAGAPAGTTAKTLAPANAVKTVAPAKAGDAAKDASKDAAKSAVDAAKKKAAPAPVGGTPGVLPQPAVGAPAAGAPAKQ